MNIIDFIEKDAKKINHEKKYFKIIFTIFLLLSLCIGYGTRADFIEAFEWFNIIPSLILAISSFLFFYFLKLRKVIPTYLSALFFFTFSLLQTQTKISLAKFVDLSKYWHENLHCFEIGSLGGLFISLSLTPIYYFLFPLQSKKSIFLNSIFISLAPTFVLSLHCPGPLKSHILISHWGSSLCIFILSSLLFYTINQKKLPSK